MKNSKLIRLLSHFTKSEWKAFKDFVNSPFFNKRTELPLLLNHLHALAPDFEDSKVEKQAIFKVLYPKQPYADKRMRYEMSYLTKLAEEFLQVQAFQEDDFSRKCYFLETLLDKKLDKYYVQEHARLKKQLDDNILTHHSNYHKKLRLADIADQHFLNTKARTIDENIQIASDNLDAYYLSKKLRYWSSMSNRQKIIAHNYNIRYKEEITQILSNDDLTTNTDVTVFYYLHHIMDEIDADKKLEELLLLLEKEHQYLVEEDLQAAYRVLINYSFRKIRQGEEEYTEKALNIYIKGIDLGLFREDGYLSPWTFKNIVSLGIRMKRYDWVEDFIKEYNSSIKPKFRQDVLNFNLADLNFRRENYDKTFEYLNQLNYSDVYFNLDGRMLLLKTYYHLDEITSLESLIASFSIYLRRNKKIADNTKKSYLNFCDLLAKRVRNRPGSLPKLLEKVKNTKPLMSRNWLVKICET